VTRRNVPAAAPHAPLAADAGRAVRWRAVGLVGAKVLGVARSLILAWLLVPDDFGLFALAIMPLDLMLGLTDTGMLQALVQRPVVEQHDYDVAWTVGVLRGILIGVLLALIATPAAALLGDPRAATVIRLVALRPVIAACASIQVAELQRQIRFRSLAITDLASAAVYTAVALVMARTFGVWALVIGMLAGAATTSALSYAIAPGVPRLRLDRERARALMTFGRWVLIGGVIAMAGEAALVTAISRTAGTAALGRYSLAASIALTPAAMVGSLIGSVAFTVHARASPDRERMAGVYRASVTAMLLLVLPVYGLLITLAPALVTHLLDARWHGITLTLQLLAIAGTLGLIFDATAALLAGAGRPQLAAVLDATFALAVAAGVWPLTKLFGIEGTAGARLCADLLAVGACAVLVRRVVPGAISRLSRPMLAIGGATLSAVLVAAVTTHLASGATAALGAGILGLIAALIVLWQIERRFDLGFRRDFLHITPVSWLARPIA
jgi:O-antigen/teichoic acid export membrane protein